MSFKTLNIGGGKSTSSATLLEGALIANTGWSGAAVKAPLAGGRTKMKRSNARPLAAFPTKASVGGTAVASLVDVTDANALYGTSALQANLVANTQLIVAPVAGLTTGINITDGIIRFWFKPIANMQAAFNIFTLELYSDGTPSAATPSANYHKQNEFAAGSDISARLTSATGTGRWQCYSIAVNNMVAVGTGATLTAVTYARLRVRTANTGVSFQIGNIEFVPNALTKAKCILSFDDGYLSQLTYAAAQMAKYGFRGVLFPSPITTTIGVDSTRLTTDQIKNLHDNLGWQIGSQAWSTESNTIIDAMTEDQFTSELGKVRNWQKSIGVTGGEHGSYFSSVGASDLIAYPGFRKHFRSIRAFYEGNASTPPIQYGETFPFGDPLIVRAINGATTAWGTSVATYLQSHVDQAISNKGVAYFGWHNDLATAGNARTGFDALLTYLDTHRDTIDVVTEEDLY